MKAVHFHEYQNRELRKQIWLGKIGEEQMAPPKALNYSMLSGLNVVAQKPPVLRLGSSQ